MSLESKPNMWRAGARLEMVGRIGFEPMTIGLKVRDLFPSKQSLESLLLSSEQPACPKDIKRLGTIGEQFEPPINRPRSPRESQAEGNHDLATAKASRPVGAKAGCSAGRQYLAGYCSGAMDHRPAGSQIGDGNPRCADRLVRRQATEYAELSEKLGDTRLWLGLILARCRAQRSVSSSLPDFYSHGWARS